MDAAELARRVRSIPAGRVTTYGDLTPGAPRHAGALLAACADRAVPWQRVVRADTPSGCAGGAQAAPLAKGSRQRRLLEAEGVPFRGERVDMRAAWAPPEADVRR